MKFCTSYNLYSLSCTSCNLYKLLVQVATCTAVLYKLQLVQNLNLYITYIFFGKQFHEEIHLDFIFLVAQSTHLHHTSALLVMHTISISWRECHMFLPLLKRYYFYGHLFVCKQDYTNTTGWNLMKKNQSIGLGPT